MRGQALGCVQGTPCRARVSMCEDWSRKESVGSSSDLLSGGLCSTGTGGTQPRLGKGNVEAVGPQNEGALEMEHSPQGGGFSGLGQGSCSGRRQGPGSRGRRASVMAAASVSPRVTNSTLSVPDDINASRHPSPTR